MFISIINRLYEPLVSFAPRLPKLVIGLVLGIIIIKFLMYLATNALKVARMPKALAGIISSLLAIVLWILFFSELARTMGLSSVALTVSGSLVVLGLALANGAGSLTSDILSGLFLAKDSDFEIGFKVKTGDTIGVIQKVDIRKVRILDEDGKVHIVPNSNLDKNGWIVIERNNESDTMVKKLASFKNKK